MIGAAVLTPQTLGIGWLLYAPLVIWAIWRAPWVELFADRRRQHLLFGTVFALFMLWLVRRDFDTGVSYHFIGMTAVTLLLDWPLAIVGGCAAQLGLVWLGRQDFAAVGVNGLLAGLGLLWFDGRFAMPEWLEDFVGYLWLIIFPEAFINGMVISALVVFCPEWLETFNRTRYLSAPWKDDDSRG
ncbi:energy-coupling factor ABC transporter permease [Pseudomonas sp. R2-60-08W]|uniref:energy-coupling factor ABC transporter permease n=1 Tax=Pseudomonas sp. R2-60-08W TaxID=1173280 RepID=UPI000F5849FF|nr:energy-coupling factor ABC transporter permease [Pseudomonas sp. R2-60-08W]AZF24981.1 putative membrane protein [Pseudomonas sp. R2-60-08W]